MTSTNGHSWDQWLGNEQVIAARIDADPVNLMNAALNREPIFKIGDELPPAWHWLYFHEAVRGDHLGVEGHAKLGGFIPPISFAEGVVPRRMWAGGTLTFERPIRLGDQATKRSRIQSITPKTGQSGQLCFVVVEHEIYVGRDRCLREEQTIVYRESAAQGHATPAQADPAPTDADFSATYRPDPILLFRYSALTYNAHRIHYDVDFCRQHEGYAGLVVHGPLTATLLLDLYARRFPNRPLAAFAYRGLSPLFHPDPFTVNGKESGQAWAANAQGGLAMRATCTFA